MTEATEDEGRRTEGPYELPPGWAWTTLSHACEIIMGQSPPSDTYNTDGTGLPFFQGKAEFGDLYPTPVKWCSRPGKVAEAGDILISVRAPVGPTNLCAEKSCIGRGLAAIRPLNGMPVKYFLYALRLYQDQLVEKATGTTFQAISGKVLRDQVIPLAPTEEQRRIVAKIEELLTSLDAGVAGLKRIQAALKRYRAAVLKAACEGRLVPQDPNDEPAEKLLERILAERRTKWEADLRAQGKDPQKAKYEEPKGPETEGLPELPEGWCWTRFAETIYSLRSGSAAVPHDAPITGFPILRSSSVRPCHVDYSDVRFLAEEDSHSIDNYLDVGDLLFTRLSGSLEYVGNCAVVRKEEASRIQYPDRIFRAKPVIADFSCYAELWFSTPISRKRIMALAKSTAGHQRISMDAIEQHVIALPPHNEQQRIVAEVERRLSILSEMEKAVKTNLARAERLRQAILRRAFEGKLVEQEADPSQSV